MIALSVAPLNIRDALTDIRDKLMFMSLAAPIVSDGADEIVTGYAIILGEIASQIAEAEKALGALTKEQK